MPNNGPDTSDYFTRQLPLDNGRTVAVNGLVSTAYADTAVVDPNVDEAWKNSSGAVTNEFSNYFEYFFSGQDIVVIIDGTEGTEYQHLPIVNIGFNITQNKMPLYGFWSYVYDTMLKGTRIIQGQFTVATKYPAYMRDVLSAISSSRHNQEAAAQFNYPKTFSQDDTLIQEYWGDTLDPATLNGQKNIFSVHPPFDFVIVYGVQNISLSTTQSSWGSSAWAQQYQDQNAWVTDTNERLVADSDVNNQSNRIVLDSCEITGCEMNFGSDGAVLCETYSFMARDIIVP